MGKNSPFLGSLPDLIETLWRLRAELLSLKGKDATAMKLARGASMSAIQEASRRMDFEFPPSYRAFLEKHNGWLHFNGYWSLLGVGGAVTGVMIADVHKRLEYYQDFLKSEAYLDDADLEKYVDAIRMESRRKQNVLYLPDHPILATDFNGGLMLFDRNRRRGDGECEIVRVQYAEVVRRFQDLVDLLQTAIADTQAELREQRANPPGNKTRKTKSSTPKAKSGRIQTPNSRTRPPQKH